MKSAKGVFWAMATCITFLKVDLVLSQSSDVDSVKIATERISISNSLNQLRDSINESISTFDNASKLAKARNAKKIEVYARELSRYSDQAKLTIDDVALTSSKGWTDTNLTRIKIKQISIRTDYYRVKKNYEKMNWRKQRRRATLTI